LRGRIFLGGEGFIEKFKGLLKAKQGTKEIPKPQRYVTRHLLRELFSFFLI
jgi:hypothetical protein